MSSCFLAANLLDAWLLSATIDGTLNWRTIDDPEDPDGDAAVRLINSPFDLVEVTVRHERTLRLEGVGTIEEHRIDLGLYWAALGATVRIVDSASHGLTVSGDPTTGEHWSLCDCGWQSERQCDTNAAIDAHSMHSAPRRRSVMKRTDWEALTDHERLARIGDGLRSTDAAQEIIDVLTGDSAPYDGESNG